LSKKARDDFEVLQKEIGQASDDDIPNGQPTQQVPESAAEAEVDGGDLS
jgi:hypothetical protein